MTIHTYLATYGVGGNKKRPLDGWDTSELWCSWGRLIFLPEGGVGWLAVVKELYPHFISHLEQVHCKYGVDVQSDNLIANC